MLGRRYGQRSRLRGMAANIVLGASLEESPSPAALSLTIPIASAESTYHQPNRASPSALLRLPATLDYEKHRLSRSANIHDANMSWRACAIILGTFGFPLTTMTMGR